jgi:hypothetical protein
VFKCERNRDRHFKIRLIASPPQENQKRGGVVNTQDNTFPEARGFTTEDILWALGVWSVIITLSPVIIFYMLMVA